MKLFRSFGAAAVAASLVAGCNGEIVPGLTVEDLIGTWTATKWEYQDQSNSSLKENVITFGFGANVTITSGGAYTGTLMVPDPSTGGIASVPFGGTISISGDALTLGFSQLIDLGVIVLDPADPPIFDVTLDPSGNTLTLFGTDFTWDFLADGVTADIASNLTIVFVKS